MDQDSKECGPWECSCISYMHTTADILAVSSVGTASWLISSACLQGSCEFYCWFTLFVWNSHKTELCLVTGSRVANSPNHNNVIPRLCLMCISSFRNNQTDRDWIKLPSLHGVLQLDITSYSKNSKVQVTWLSNWHSPLLKLVFVRLDFY